MVWGHELQRLADQTDVTGDLYLDQLYNEEPGAFYYRFLHRLAARCAPSVCVELGVCHGRGTAHLAAADGRNRVLAIDIAPMHLFSTIQMHYPNIELHRCTSTDTALLRTIPLGSVGLCFVDTEHHYAQVRSEFLTWWPKMRSGGIFLFDDISLNEEMVQFWNELPLPTMSFPHLHWSGFGAALVT